MAIPDGSPGIDVRLFPCLFRDDLRVSVVITPIDRTEDGSRSATS